MEVSPLPGSLLFILPYHKNDPECAVVMAPKFDGPCRYIE
jgi:hypothetical protein